MAGESVLVRGASGSLGRLNPLAEAALAHHKMDAGEVFGRIVLIPQG
ncbi:hypothetical protein [Lentzea waywayandensis]|nr:hypothetical protein [Lentzea waywayandensis]